MPGNLGRDADGELYINGGTDGTLIGNTSNALHVLLRDGTGIETGTVANPLTVDGTISAISVPVDGTKASYSATVSALTAVALATDVFTLTGSATKTIRVTRIEITGSTTAGSGISVNLSILKRTTANTGGTTSNLVELAHDSNSAAATATAVAYTVNPTLLGTSAGTYRAVRASFGTAGLTAAPYIWQFGDRPSQSIVLRGTSEILAINLGTITITGGILAISVEWTEES